MSVFLSSTFLFFSFCYSFALFVHWVLSFRDEGGDGVVD